MAPDTQGTTQQPWRQLLRGSLSRGFLLTWEHRAPFLTTILYWQRPANCEPPDKDARKTMGNSSRLPGLSSPEGSSGNVSSQSLLFHPGFFTCRNSPPAKHLGVSVPQ